MNEGLENHLKSSSFEIVPGTYVYTKVRTLPTDNSHFMVSKDSDEITVVTKVDNLSHIDMIERNREDYCLIALHVAVPFYSKGFLAAISKAIADKNMNILIISTYSKDYILVAQNESNQAKDALLQLGLGERRDT